MFIDFLFHNLMLSAVCKEWYIIPEVPKTKHLILTFRLQEDGNMSLRHRQGNNEEMIRKGQNKEQRLRNKTVLKKLA